MKYLLVLCVMLAGCTQQQLGKVRDASEKRDAICNFVEVWAQEPLLANRTEVAIVLQKCRAGATLKEIARAYGQCDGPPVDNPD